jgi:hypothetical protein
LFLETKNKLATSKAKLNQIKSFSSEKTSGNHSKICCGILVERIKE